MALEARFMRNIRLHGRTHPEPLLYLLLPYISCLLQIAPMEIRSTLPILPMVPRTLRTEADTTSPLRAMDNTRWCLTRMVILLHRKIVMATILILITTRTRITITSTIPWGVNQSLHHLQTMADR